MRIFRFTVFLFYRYYSTGKTSGIPIANTVFALSMLFILNFYSLLSLFNGTGFIPSADSTHRLETLFKTFIFISPVLLLFWFCVLRLKPENMQYDKKLIKKGQTYLVLYIVFSMALLVFISFYKHKNA